jgi:hypothetical protein
MYNPKTKRAKKLNAIMTKIAMYVVNGTCADEEKEGKARWFLNKAIKNIEEAQKLIDEGGE